MFGQLPISSLEQRRQAAAVGLTCKLLHGDAKTPLKSLTPEFEDSSKVKPRRSARVAPTKSHNHQLQFHITMKSLEVFKRSYRGRIPEIWNKMNSDSLKDDKPDWVACRRQLQREISK